MNKCWRCQKDIGGITYLVYDNQKICLSCVNASDLINSEYKPEKEMSSVKLSFGGNWNQGHRIVNTEERRSDAEYENLVQPWVLKMGLDTGCV